jgi:hypothetical protein
MSHRSALAAAPPAPLEAFAVSLLRMGWPEIAAALGFAASVVLLRDVPLGHDAIWQLWIGRQLAHGARLYIDIVEVNPPAWFWMAIPLIRISELAGTSPREVLRLAFFVALALSLLLVAAVRRDPSPGSRFALYVSVLLAGTIVVLPDFGQREQYVLLASIPYVALIAGRAEKTNPPPAWLAAAIGVFAASGLAVKVHCALMPLVLEAWLWFRLRPHWSGLRPESLALAFCAAAYGASVLAFSPEYLHATLPFLLLSYPRFGDPPLFFLAYQAAVGAAFLALVACRLYRGPRSAMGEAAFVSAMAFLVSYLAQAKGWRYHTFPALGMLVVLACVESTTLRPRFRPDRPGAFALASAFLLAVFYSLYPGPYHNDKYELTRSALAGLERGDTVMVLAVNPPIIWPMVEDLGLVWPSRYMSLWMLPAIARAQPPRPTSPDMEELARTVRRQTLEDLRCHPPRRIVADDPLLSLGTEASQFGYIEFLRRDPEFRAFLAHYRTGPTIGRLATFERVDSDGLARHTDCRKVF